MSSSFLQSKNWLDFQKFLGREVFEYEKDGISAKIIKHELLFGKSYLYIPHGPEIDFQPMTGGIKNPIKDFVGWLKQIAKTNRAIFVKIEPLSDQTAQIFAENGFKKSKKEIQPSKTVVIDLTKSEDELLDAMHYKTRYNIRVAEKHGVEIGESGDTEAFWDLMRKTTARDKFSSHPKDYYFKLLNFFKSLNFETLERGEILTKLFLAKHDEKPIAGVIILFWRDSAFYLHGVSDYDYRPMMAPHLLHWRIINYLKERGFKTYDFWGINVKKWPGVTRFKLGWDGRTVEYPGSFDLTISKFWHILYEVARALK